MSNTIQSKDLATTPLSTNDILAIVQGGVLKRTTIGDLPEGASLVENSNGTALRLPVGIQICVHEINLGAGNAVGAGTLADMYRSVSQNWTFPAAFSSTPLSCHTSAEHGQASGADRFVTANYRTVSTTTMTDVQTYRGTNVSGDVVIQLLAIGEWSA